MSKLYMDNGYINIRYILGLGLPFNFIVGGRGTGKTYTSLKSVAEDKTMFMFMRRTQSQVDIINKPEFCPFKAINADMGWTISTKSISKYSAGFYHTEDNNGKAECVGLPIGYTCALSTISNMRGFDATDIQVIIYDEFIPEKHERPLKNEADAFFNAYETINRNRELKGQKPVQVLCLANANDLANPLFMSLGLVRKAEQMRKKGQEISLDVNRGIGLFILNTSPISDAKQDTALYNLVNGGAFREMSLNNSFIDFDTDNVKSRPLKEYKPLLTVGELTIYEHKNNRRFYVSTHASGSVPVYGTDDMERQRFVRSCYWLWNEVLENNVDFEEYLCLALLTKYFK